MPGYWADATIANLRPQFPSWVLWYVPMYPNKVKWCARKVGADSKSTLQCDTPEELVTAIGQSE